MLSALPSFKSRELVEHQELTSGERYWCFKVSAGGELPPAIAKIASPELFSWLEKGTFNPKEHTLSFVIEPLAAKSKFESTGKFTYTKLKKGTLRVFEGEMNVKIPFVGKLVEGFLLAELKKNYAVEPEIQTKFHEMMMKA